MSDMNAEARVTVILAGGRGERLGGVNKATLRLGGQRLLDHVLRRLCGESPVLLAIGAQDPADFAPLHDLIPLPDPVPGLGPLGGIAGALAFIERARPEAETLLTLAVDAPLIPWDFAQRLSTGLAGGPGESRAAVATHGGQWHATHALYRIAGLREALEALPQGAGPRALLQQLQAKEVDFPASDGRDPFFSANTPEAVAALERQLAGADFPPLHRV